MSDKTKNVISSRILRNRILCGFSGSVNQEERLTFSFYQPKRPDIMSWLEEKDISYKIWDPYVVIVKFTDENLAMEFKLRFI
jgi:hypothetical protein